MIAARPANLGIALSAELRLLCACLRWPLSDERAAAVAAASRQAIDWNGFLALTRTHRVQGLVEAAMKRAAVPVPQEIASEISKDAIRIATANLAAGVALNQAVSALQDESVDVLVLKGLPLSLRAYGTLAVRQSKDLDLLIQPADRDRAAAILRRLGYRRVAPTETAGSNLLRIWTVMRKDYVFRRRGIEIELHWRPTYNEHLLSLAWNPATWETVSPDLPVRSLGDDDLFAYLCVHGASTGWHRLKWLADVAALLDRCESGEIAARYCAARKRGAERPAGQVLLLCRDLFGTSVPQGLLDRLRADRVVVWLERLVLKMLVRNAGREPHSVSFGLLRPTLARMMLSASARYKWREIRIGLGNPVGAEASGVPDGLLFVFPLLRPFLWLMTQLRRLERV